MKLVLPKASRGWHFSRLFTIEMNDFDVERLLPSLFFLVVTKGRKRGPRKNDPQAFDRYLDSLLEHERYIGFNNPVGRRMADRWLRAAILRTSRTGRGRQAEQIDFLLPLTLLCYKTGFPTEIRRQRGVHVFLYLILRDALPEDDVVASAAHLNQIFRSVFGNSVREPIPPTYNSHYDGETDIDIHSLLSLFYLDGFEASPTGPPEKFAVGEPAIPSIATNAAQDVLRYLLAYGKRLPVQAVTRGLMALINFELFTYTVTQLHSINNLYSRRTLPASMLDESRPDLGSTLPELYVDFTRQRASRSDDLARACVDREFEEIRRYIESVFYFRTVDRLIQFIPRLKASADKLTTPLYLARLCELAEDSDVTASARVEIANIRETTLEACQNDAEHQAVTEFFAEVVERDHELATLVSILSESQRKNPLDSAIAWYRSVGGLRKPFGILSGNLAGRRNWRYAMSDDLLATLVYVAMASDGVGHGLASDLKHVVPRVSLRLSSFLEFLERRYGVLVNRPPAFLDDATARAAAAENLEALKRRLRQMGFFRALSDDFNAQYLQMPELEEVSP